MKDLDLEILPTFKVSIHSKNREGFNGSVMKTVLKMDNALLNAIIERKFLPEIGDIIHFTSIDPGLELKIINVFPVISKDNKLGNLIIHGESNLFKVNKDYE